MSAKSIGSDQSVILANILRLNKLERFGADITYGNGSFYKNIPEPIFKFDIDPQTEDTVKADSTKLPLKNESMKSLVFDPPFLTYIKSGREHGSIMSKRYGGYWRYDELASHYQNTLKETGTWPGAVYLCLNAKT